MYKNFPQLKVNVFRCFLLVKTQILFIFMYDHGWIIRNRKLIFYRTPGLIHKTTTNYK